MRRVLAWVAGVLVPLVSGCGGPAESEVSGTVTINGQPLPDGEIIFEDPAKAMTPAAGKIVNGKYSVKVLPGPKKVKVLASRPSTAKADKAMGAAPHEQAIGPEYNDQSKLTADIIPGGQTVDFEVKELPKKK